MFGRPVALVAVVVLFAGCTSPTPPTAQPSPYPTERPTFSTSRPPTPTLTSTPRETVRASPTPISGASPLPTITDAPSASAPATSGLAVSADDIGQHLDALMQIATQNNGIRAAGTAGYVASADYVAGQLTSMGYDVQRVPFDFTFFDETSVQLTVGDQSWSNPDWLHSMLYAGSGDVTGPLQAIQLSSDGLAVGTGGCDFGDWAGFVRDNIAVVGSGPCFRHDQVMNAQNAGAAAVISLYPKAQANQVRRPTLVFPTDVLIPAVTAGGEPSAAILAALAAGGSAHVNAQVVSQPATNDDVIAQWPGSEPGVVMLGGHLDSVLDGPGINDNGSGVATLLSLARAVTQTSSARTVRFGFWGAEEYGELGSSAYVQGLSPSDVGLIGSYLNLDMVASPNAARYVYGDAGAPAGSDELAQMLLDALTAAGTPGLTTDISGSSDHFMFEQRGVPSAGVFSGLNPLSAEEAATFGGQAGIPADPCYHLSCDTRDNVSLDSAVTLGNAVASVLQDLAYQP